MSSSNTELTYSEFFIIDIFRKYITGLYKPREDYYVNIFISISESKACQKGSNCSIKRPNLFLGIERTLVCRYRSVTQFSNIQD